MSAEFEPHPPQTASSPGVAPAVPQPRVRGRHQDADAEPAHHIGHPRPARHSSPYVYSVTSEAGYMAVADVGSAAGSALPAAPRPRQLPRFPRAGRLLLVVALVGAVGWQSYRLDRLENRVADADRQLAEAVAVDRASVSVLQNRAAALEAESARAFNPESVATAVVPSVFRVRAGNFTGTAFAVGGAADDEATNLFTNFHVVQSVWEAGDRTISLERGDVKLPADIVKVDKGHDLALLRVSKEIAGLATDPSTVKSGQQIIVVGAPLGLEDTVTTGVISALRKDKNAMIQFDAPINPGNSGGPVINSAKQVVGLATAKARDSEGIGLAIPIKTACDKLDACSTSARVRAVPVRQ